MELSKRAADGSSAIIKSREKPKIDTRIAIGIGKIDEAALNTKRVSESTGETFTESGRALSEIRSRRRRRTLKKHTSMEPPWSWKKEDLSYLSH
jgi:hypothetical protein